MATPALATDVGATSPAVDALQFSTADWPANKRCSSASEFCGYLFRQNIETLPDRPFRMQGMIRRSPGLSVVWATTSGLVSHRRAEHVTSDDVLINLNLAGVRSLRQPGSELVIRAGEALLASDVETGVVTVPAPNRYISLRIPAKLLGLTARIRTRVARVVPADNNALRLLGPYLRTLQDPELSRMPDLQRLTVNHVHDLVTMMLGATGEAAEIAEGRGMRAARLAAIKEDIVRNLGVADVSVGALALRHRVTPRTIQMLFEGEGATLTGFVLQQRLARAHRRLSDPLKANEKIAMIAIDAGFGDLSYFNQAFRRRYGASPSDVRARARHMN